MLKYSWCIEALHSVLFYILSYKSPCTCLCFAIEYDLTIKMVPLYNRCPGCLFVIFCNLNKLLLCVSTYIYVCIRTYIYRHDKKYKCAHDIACLTTTSTLWHEVDDDDDDKFAYMWSLSICIYLHIQSMK